MKKLDLKTRPKAFYVPLAFVAALIILWAGRAALPDAPANVSQGQPQGAPVRQVDGQTQAQIGVPAGDAAIYQLVEEYVRSLVADDRPAVQSLLTSGHRETFAEESYLLRPGTRDAYDEITVSELNHSFPTYTSQFPGLEGIRVAVIVAQYTVQFKQNGQVVESPSFREELLLREEGGRWLIAASQREMVPLETQ